MLNKPRINEVFTVEDLNQIFSRLSHIIHDGVDFSVLGYGYYYRSGDKKSSKLCRNISDVSAGSSISNLISLLEKMFGKKWSGLYDSLYATYNPLNDYEHNETRNYNYTGSDNKTIENNTTHNKTNTDNTRTNTQTNIKITETSKDNTRNQRYGFNSVNAVPTDNTDSDNTSTRSGSGADNNIEETSTISGESQDSSNATDVTTGSKTGNETETITKSGRNKTPAEILSAEFVFRLENELYKVIFEDMDSVMTLPMY